MGSMSFDAVLCDLDGVLRWWDPEIMSGLDWANSLPAGTLAKTAFAPHRLNPAITGEQTDEQWRTAIAADLAEACGTPEAARALVAEWSAHPGEVVEEVAELLAAAREHSAENVVQPQDLLADLHIHGSAERRYGGSGGCPGGSGVVLLRQLE